MSSQPDLADHYPPGSLKQAVRFSAEGLVPVVTQDHRSGEILMMAYANAEALDCTLVSGLATYFSRSRGGLWVKGATSGNLQFLVELRLDCDGDAVLYRVSSDGPACHTGRRSCFSWAVGNDGSITCDRAVMATTTASLRIQP